MVVSTSEVASRVGVAVMERGGNAVDAAVAVALALAVTFPQAGNLGGGGFMMIRRADGRVEVIDYRERAPAGAGRDMYLDEKGGVVKDASTVGYRAVGVPGTVAGLAMALERHGSMKWAELVEPARKLAAEGVVLGLAEAMVIRFCAGALGKFADSKRIFLRDGKLYDVGERLVQADLAATLGRLAKEGPREFYGGDGAADRGGHGGARRVGDGGGLAEYKPTVRKPLKGAIAGIRS